MGKLAQQIIERLQQAKTASEIEDILWKAGDLMAKLKITNYRSGFDYIDAEDVTIAEGEQIKSLLLELLKTQSDTYGTASIINALSRSYDPQLRDLYRTHLEQSLMKLLANNALLYSCLIALDDLSEDVFERDINGSSQSLDGIEKNVRQARAYIKLIKGIDIHW